MVSFLRRRRPPASARARLARDERVVAWAAADAETVVVTNLGLWLPGRDDRLSWHLIHKASWSGTRLSVVPAMEVADGAGYTVTADAPVVVVAISEPGDVPLEVRRRVNQSIARTTHHELAGGGGVRVVARRVAGVSGVYWQVRYDDGTDGADAAIVAATEELVEAAAAEIAAAVA